jgi:hypothetical protein
MAAADIAHQRQADAEALELGLAMHALKDAKQLAARACSKPTPLSVTEMQQPPCPSRCTST